MSLGREEGGEEGRGKGRTGERGSGELPIVDKQGGCLRLDLRTAEQDGIDYGETARRREESKSLERRGWKEVA